MTPWALAANVTLTWDESDPAPDSYRLFQRTAGQSYDYNNEVYEGSNTQFFLTSLAPNTTYYFVVRARSGQNESSNSNEVSYRTPADTDPNTDPNNGGGTTNKVIDNGRSGSSSTGSWSTSKGPNPYGGNSLYSRDPGATYTYKTSTTGVLDLSMWWTEWASRPTAAQIKIYDGSTLLDTVYVNQRNNGGRWNKLGQGRYSFSSSARVTIVSGGSSSSTCADAVKFSVYSNTPDPGINPDINSPNPNPGSGTSTTRVIDNGRSGSSSTGSWSTSKGPNPYGGNSLYSRDPSATYTYKLSTTGILDLSMWWTEWASRPTAAQIKIYDGNTLLDTVYVNQRNNGGQWNQLGQGMYSFSNSARVTIVSRGSSSSICADAVKFSVYSDTPDPDINPNANPNGGGGTSTDIVIDNGDSGSNSTGLWKTSGAKNPYGGDSLYSKQANAYYSYSSPVTGKDLEISVWYTEWSSRCTSVPVDIYDGNKYLGTRLVDQSKEGGQWKVLGKYNFTEKVEIEIVSEGSSCSTNADAVRIRQAR